MKPREIVLLLVIIFVGVTISLFQSGRLNHLDFWWEKGFEQGEGFSFQEIRTIEPPFPGWLTIDNPRGEVIIDKAAGDKLEISWEKKIWAEKEAEAAETAEEIKLLVTKSASEIRVNVLLPKKIRRSYRSYFRISAPASLSVKIDNSHGQVKVDGMSSVSVTNSHGQVTLRSVAGDLYLHNRHGDVSVEEVAGKSDILVEHGNGAFLRLQQKAIISGRYANFDLEDLGDELNLKAEHVSIRGRRIKGPLFISTSHEPVDLKEVGEAEVVNRYGLIRIDGAKGALSIENRYGSVAVSQVEGSLKVTGKNSRITARSVSGGEIYVSSAYDNVDLKEFSAKTTIFLRHGDCFLEPATLAPGLSFQGDYSSLRLLWPEGEKLPAEIRTDQGKIVWRLSEPATHIERNGETVIRAFFSGQEEAKIIINNKFGDVVIEKTMGEGKKPGDYFSLDFD